MFGLPLRASGKIAGTHAAPRLRPGSARGGSVFAQWSAVCFREQGVEMEVRIAIAVESDQARWVAYGASDTPDCEVMNTVRDIVGGHPVTMWLEVQLPRAAGDGSGPDRPAQQ